MSYQITISRDFYLLSTKICLYCIHIGDLTRFFQISGSRYWPLAAQVLKSMPQLVLPEEVMSLRLHKNNNSKIYQ